MRLTSLNIHPVKSTAIRPVNAARVLARGLDGDRSWMVVDEDGVLVSARECHRLFTITADTASTDSAVVSGLRLRAEGSADLHLVEPVGETIPVRLHGTHLAAIPAGGPADDWIRAVIDRNDVRLVWCDDPTRRQLNPEYSRPGDHTAFADGYPVTIASRASLNQLNDWIQGPDPLPMQRFRPNLVVDGAAAFAEDRWQRIQVGSVRFRVAKPVDRCVMTTIDLTTLESGHEPIRTLARHRRLGTKTMFALHLIPESPGIIAVGDEVSAE